MSHLSAFPWSTRIEGAKDTCIVLDRNGNPLLRFYAGRRSAGDGAVVAAGPELLKALELSLDALAMCAPRTDHGRTAQRQAMLLARAAIAKARGE